MPRLTKELVQIEKATSYSHGFQAGKMHAEATQQQERRAQIIRLTEAAATLAKANASLTYSLSRIMEGIK